MPNRLPKVDFRHLYDRFDAPVAALDCGLKCAPHNPSGKPFCCDICHAVPAVYRSEWAFLRRSTDLWHPWGEQDCPQESPAERERLRAETPAAMRLLACKGPAHCQRDYRALSCRQFPFFPYITADGRFIGLAYEWDFEPYCWVISNLPSVTAAYRQEFVGAFDALFDQWPDEIESYALHAEEMRAQFAARRRRIPILHRNGSDYLLSPGSERLQRAAPQRFRRFGPYQTSD